MGLARWVEYRTATLTLSQAREPDEAGTMNWLLVLASYDLDDAPQDQHASQDGQSRPAVCSAQGQLAAQSAADEHQPDNDVPHGAPLLIDGIKILSKVHDTARRPGLFFAIANLFDGSLGHKANDRILIVMRGLFEHPYALLATDRLQDQARVEAHVRIPVVQEAECGFLCHSPHSRERLHGLRAVLAGPDQTENRFHGPRVL